MLAWKCMGGNISLILAYAMHISYKVSSTNYLDIWSLQRQHHFDVYQYASDERHQYLLYGSDCTCETASAIVAEL